MGERPDANAARREQAEALQQAIHEHPAFREYHAIRALDETFSGVYLGNHSELVEFLGLPSKDEELAIELIQNVKAPRVRGAFIARLLRSLHNYLASSQSLVEHVRRVMRDREGATVGEFDRRRVALRHDAAIVFFQDLRNYTMHRALPPIVCEVRFPDPGASDGIDAEIQLAVAPLEEWGNWRPPAQELLRGAGSALTLQPLVDQHAVRMIELNGWLIRQLAEDNAMGLAAVNELIVKQETVATGLDPAVVRQRIKERSTRTDYPAG